MRIRGVRGAIVIGDDTSEAILGATTRLVGEMLTRNGIAADDLISVIFTATPDLHAAFPAAAARQMGLTGVPLLCAAELDIDGAMERVVRVLMHVELPDGATPAHVYLDGAESLRDDL